MGVDPVAAVGYRMRPPGLRCIDWSARNAQRNAQRNAARGGARYGRTLLLLGVLAGSAVAPAVGQGLPQGDPAALGVSPERLGRLSTALDGYVERGELAGGVALVARRGRTVFRHAFGHRDIESGSEMTEETIFRIASQTKAIVSVAIMILQEEGKLLISDPVGRHLPEFRETTVAEPVGEEGEYRVIPAERPITIRDLLTHTAGLGYGGGPGRDRWDEAEITGWYFAHRDEPVRETVRRMAALPFPAQPGSAFVYGYATDVLGAVVEVASGTPLDRFLADRILGPLEMRDTFFYLPDSVPEERLATVYSSTGSGLERAPDVSAMVGQGAYVDGPRRSFSGGAGLLSTAPDYLRFLQMMLGGGELDGVRILSRKSVELMVANHIGDLRVGSGGFGLGFSVVLDLGASGRPGSVGEYGWGGAYHTTYWVDPVEDLAVVYMTQLIPAGIDDHAKLRALVYQAIVDE